jgi:hypothetical protein
MGLRAAEDTGSRFVAFVDGLVSVIGHADRAGPLRDYCTGLVMPCERKSVEPMAAVTAPANVGAQHQSLLHFVGEAPWSDGESLGCPTGVHCRASSAITARAALSCAVQGVTTSCRFNGGASSTRSAVSTWPRVNSQLLGFGQTVSRRCCQGPTLAHNGQWYCDPLRCLIPSHGRRR